MSTDTFNLIDRKELVKNIDSIGKRGRTLRADIAAAAPQAWAHAAEHGDLTLATRLVVKSPKSFQSDLRKYFGAFAPVRWDSKAQQFKKSKKGGAFDPRALDTAFDAVETDKAEPEYNEARAVANLIKSMAKLRDNAELTGNLDLAIKLEIMLENLKPAPIATVEIAA